ncbi:alpha/beta fold hydrolase [Tumebacillus permanentifrigoris]|uniref:Proline iminopeptidase n=1 Tax=Tumebacillus permanentifrigoris TaxID=378543 RepID=A0A316DCH1_9BACL|nr:alpha/beta hydrolase [Tumebacillus permanentifrigoris]PWK15674.1 proline iminopeptidase [Tumebacillus permanentifrigoris]
MTQTQWIPIRGKGLYVEAVGPEDAPALLFLHGGPGGTGCYEFMLAQRERLSQNLRVIALDQRGVLRSEALTEEDPLTLQDLLEDFEALREHFGYLQWSVLGHSFGGFLATLYAHQYRESVEKLLLDCPALDFDLCTKYMLQKSAAEFTKLGNAEQVAAATTLLQAELPVQDRYSQMVELSSKLEEHRDNLYWYRPTPGYFGNLINNSGLPKDNWERTEMHVQKLYADPSIFQSLLPLLPELTCPTLLIRGESDSVTCDVQAAAVLRDVAVSEEVVIAEAGHVPAVEQAERFAEVVTEFVLRD